MCGKLSEPIDSDAALRALMEKIHRSYTPSDKSRAEIADAIARHLGIDYPSLHRRSRSTDA